MDIAKIRKKAQAQIQSQGQPQGQNAEEKPGELVRHQVDGPLQESSEQPSGNQSLNPVADLTGKPADETGTQAGISVGALEIPERADLCPAEPGAAAAPEVRGTGGGEGHAAGEQEDGGVSELLTFSLAKEEFAFKVSEVEEIIRFQRITLVPTMPEYVAGITSLRGKIIPVIDLRTRLALKDEGEEAAPIPTADADGLIEGTGKIIVLSGPLGLIGAIIDKVLGVVRLPDDVILEPPAHLTEDETRFIEGVVIVEKRFISIIRSADALNIEVG